MTRLPMILALLVLANGSVASAWELQTGATCTLSHTENGSEIIVTYDPGPAIYAIEISRDTLWRNAAVFAMRFDGGQSVFIQTDRHRISGDRRTLTVTDSGFGNVLNGLQYNSTASAILGDDALAFSLAGAEKPVRAFRACAAGLSA